MAKIIFYGNEASVIIKNDVFVVTKEIVNKIPKNFVLLNVTVKLDGVRGENFKVFTKNASGDWQLNDYITATVDNKVFLNVTEELSDAILNGMEKLVIRLGDESRVSEISSCNIVIEYISEQCISTGNVFYDIDCGKSGNGKVNLAVGSLSYNHIDSVTSGISHIYNSWQADKIDFTDSLVNRIWNKEEKRFLDYDEIKSIYGDFGCGKGWKLNMHQYLLTMRGSNSEDNYVYIDGYGNYHEFNERFYYKENGVKHYASKHSVTIENDGKLSYTNNDGIKFDVFSELKSNGGYTLQTDITGFIGSEKLDTRSEERVRIEEDIINIERTVEDCRYALREYDKAENVLYKTMLEQQTEMEKISAEIERSSIETFKQTELLMNAVIDKKKELSYYIQKGINGKYLNNPGFTYDNRLEEYETASKVVEQARINATPEAETEPSNENQGYKGPIRSQLQKQAEASENLSKAQKELSRVTDLVNLSLSDYSNRIENYNWEETKLANSRRAAMLAIRDEFIKNKYEYEKTDNEHKSERNKELYARTVEDLKRANNLLEKLKYEHNKIKEQEPTKYLSDESGIIYAFNDKGILVGIADSYENIIYIIYENGKIKSVQDTDNNVTTLEYTDGLLTHIIDCNDKIIKFDYYNDTLSRITYPDGTSSQFGYIGKRNMLMSVKEPSGLGKEIEYEYDRVKNIYEFTNTYEISDNGVLGLNEEEKRKQASIIYNTAHSTTVSIGKYENNIGTSIDMPNKLNDNTTYVFDNTGRPITVYKGIYYEPGESTESLSIDYKNSFKSYSIADNAMYDNLLRGISPTVDISEGTPSDIRIKKYSIDVNNLPNNATDFVFSAWAKADSAYISTERKTDYGFIASEEHIEFSDENKRRRKFELRAEITYDDGTVKRNSASYDWQNNDWQYLALPVTINESDDIGDKLSGKFPFVLGDEPRKLIAFDVIIDYSYNTNSIEIDCASLREGKWEYSEYSTDGKIIYSENNKKKITYEYDEKGNMITETTTDIKHRKYVNKYEYNKQNSLIRKTDYNGLVEECIYDDKGRPIKSITYSITDPTGKIYAEKVMDEKDKILAEVDISGEFNSTEYGYDHKGVVTTVKDAYGNKTAFGYYNDKLVSLSAAVNGEENRNTINYTLGYITKVSAGNTDYTYSYDKWGRQKQIDIAGNEYCRTEYIDDYNTKMILSDGNVFIDKKYSKEDETETIERLGDKVNVVYECKKEETLFYPKGVSEAVLLNRQFYDEKSGLLIRSNDNSGNIPYTVNYYYDKEGRLTNKVSDGAGSIEQSITYKEDDGIDSLSYILNDDTANEQKYIYKYDNTIEDKKVSITMPNGEMQSIKYDGLGRLSGISFDNNDSKVYSKEYGYIKYGEHSTNLIAGVTEYVNGNREDITKYTYDKIGNITAVHINGKERARYKYDSLNRLIREDNISFKEKSADEIVVGKTITYEYDNNGNVLFKTVYPYTLDTVLKNGKRVTYNYREDGWRDQILSVNNELIGSYDTMGNPINYRGKILKWEKGRNLISCNGIGYSYNFQGIRTNKTNGETETVFYLDGSRIIAEERRDLATDRIIETVYYHYGYDGLKGFEYQRAGAIKQNYFYRKNIQGDITHIYSADGEKLVEYIYDAWGNQSISAVSGYENLANRNPFRYRGYYYDIETGFYYLNSRYYDPEIGRFINADTVTCLDPETLGGLNLYSYCGNNPVMNIDPDGNAWWNPFSWDWGKAFSAIGKAFSTVGNWINNNILKPVGKFLADNWEILLGVGITIGLAAISIATLGAGLSLVGVVTGAVIGAGFGGLNALVVGDNVLYGMVSGMVIGALGSLGGNGIGSLLLTGITAATGAATMSIIGDSVNGRPRNYKKAGITALTAGIFSFLGKGASDFLSNVGEELSVKIIGNVLGALTFNTYSFITDLLMGKLFKLA